MQTEGAESAGSAGTPGRISNQPSRRAAGAACRQDTIRAPPHLHIPHVAGGDDDARHARCVRCQQLLLHAAHRQHQPAQRQLACGRSRWGGGGAHKCTCSSAQRPTRHLSGHLLLGQPPATGQGRSWHGVLGQDAPEYQVVANWPTQPPDTLLPALTPAAPLLPRPGRLPVMAVSARTHLPVNSDTSATASVTPAEGPSLGTAPVEEKESTQQQGERNLGPAGVVPCAAVPEAQPALLCQPALPPLLPPRLASLETPSSACCPPQGP